MRTIGPTDVLTTEAHRPAIFFGQQGHEKSVSRYTCSDYRLEMILVGLRRRLSDPRLNDAEKQRLLEQIRLLEQQIGLED